MIVETETGIVNGAGRDHRIIVPAVAMEMEIHILLAEAIEIVNGKIGTLVEIDVEANAIGTGIEPPLAEKRVGRTRTDRHVAIEIHMRIDVEAAENDMKKDREIENAEEALHHLQRKESQHLT
jgi:hypothetical protein